MESRGLPCTHIVAILAHLNIKKLPESLVLKRWTKGAKDYVQSYSNTPSNHWEAQKIFRCGALMNLYRKLSKLQSDSVEDYNEATEKAVQEIKAMEDKRARQRAGRCAHVQNEHESLRDPVRVRHKGGPSGSTTGVGLRSKRTTRCGYCRVAGHNRVTCPIRGGHDDNLRNFSQEDNFVSA
ncbi:hypothetical protein SESBI_45431 [Sesbania bispinosa]|nr:hypothetical protein SESBI_45431 [Sesbania bispinosa]